MSSFVVKLNALVACLFAMVAAGAAAAVSPKLTPQAKIVGGTTTTISVHPYAIQVYVSGSFICGGSLINENFVLTAAHCTEDYKYTQFTVKGGATTMNNAGVTRKLKRIIRPAGYSSETLNMDWSLLHLESALTGTNIAVIPLYTGSVPAGATVTVSGWGATSENGGSSNQLQTVDLKRVSAADCKKAFPRETITKYMLCAKLAKKDSCYGDSGGPLTFENELAGIVSWGYGCAGTQPGVYTDVSAIADTLNGAITKWKNK